MRDQLMASYSAPVETVHVTAKVFILPRRPRFFAHFISALTSKMVWKYYAVRKGKQPGIYGTWYVYLSTLMNAESHTKKERGRATNSWLSSCGI